MSEKTQNSKPNIAKEYIHSCYVRNQENRNKDAIFVKERLHNLDTGQTKNHFRIIEDYERPFWITKKAFRNHNDKKEFEYEEKLDKFYSTQTNLSKSVFKALNGYNSSAYIGFSELCRSPYVYGTYISPTVLLATEYQKAFPDTQSVSTLAILDYETDMLNGTEQIISGVLSYKENLAIMVTKEFIGSIKPIDIQNAIRHHIGDHLDKVNTKNIIVSYHKNAAEIVCHTLKLIHEWSPDFVGIWNIEFDIGKMMLALNSEGIDPALVFSSPKVPDEYKYFQWVPDSGNKMKGDGKSNKKHSADLWHSVISPSESSFICMMALFKALRVGEQQRSSYSLDAILEEVLGLNKLKFKGMAEDLEGPDWHYKMQRDHKLEYMVYMAFDGISLALLDQKTGDVAKALRIIVGTSDLAKSKSNPRSACDELHFYYADEGKILCSVSDNMMTELDKEIPSKDDWIITLAPELEVGIGVKIIEEFPNLATDITTHARDEDIITSYPTCGCCMNVSKTTRVAELCRVDGLGYHKTRSIGINLTSVRCNGLALANMLYEYPTLDDSLKEFKKEMKIAA